MGKFDNFIEHRHRIQANYSDYSLRIDVPPAEIESIIIEPVGYFQVEGVRLYELKMARFFELVPPVILRTRPLESPSYIVIPFLKALNLSAYQAGDIQLGFSISGFRYPGASLSPVPEELVINFHKTD